MLATMSATLSTALSANSLIKVEHSVYPTNGWTD